MKIESEITGDGVAIIHYTLLYSTYAILYSLFHSTPVGRFPLRVTK